MASLHCVFVGVFSDLRVDWKTCCIQYNWRAFLCCVLKCAFSLNLAKCMNNHNSAAWLLLIWYFKLSFSLNDLLQSLQMNLFSLSVCFKICTFRFPAETLEWLQKLHLYGLSPVWMRLWIFKLPCSLNDLLHSAQLNGFSPVCVKLWFLSFPIDLVENAQKMHLCGFSPVWIKMCLFKSLPSTKDLKHRVQDILSFVMFSVISKKKFWLKDWIYTNCHYESFLPTTIAVVISRFHSYFFILDWINIYILSIPFHGKGGTLFNLIIIYILDLFRWQMWALSLGSAYPHHIRGADKKLTAPQCGAD